MRNKIVVLIPCYNEEKTIAKVIGDYKRCLPEAEIYVYDNNCTDKTACFAKRAGAVVRNENKQGKGSVVRTMFSDISADCYLMADGDDACPANKAREMCRIILAGKADMVIGDRLSSGYFRKNDRRFHNFGNRLVRLLVNAIYKSDVKDVLSGYRAFSKGFVKECSICSNGYEIETELTMFALSRGFRIVELPISYKNREGSTSRLKTINDGTKIVATIFRLSRRYRRK